VLGAPRGAGTLPAVWQDDKAATRAVIGYLAGLGHRRIARIGGFPRYWHSKLRTDALAEVAGAACIQAFSVAADYTAEHGAEATRDLLKEAEPPTAILYDNDVMALAGLGAAQRMGVRVPADLSIVVWDDTALCELVHPAFTALRRDIPAAGAAAARMLREASEGGRPGSLQEAPPVLMVRDSTEPAPGSRRAS
jgi:DNA-binding LacI/PurR family transcriptional regulator